MQSRVEMLWNEYAAQRFGPSRRVELRAMLESNVAVEYNALAVRAEHHGGRLDFDQETLLLRVLLGLGEACEYCGEFYGVESMGVVRRNPLLRVRVGNVHHADFGIAAYAVCCRSCANGKDAFTDDQWRDLLAALRKCDDGVQRAAVMALGGVGEGRRYFPHPGALRVTRERQNFSSKTAKK